MSNLLIGVFSDNGQLGRIFPVIRTSYTSDGVTIFCISSTEPIWTKNYRLLKKNLHFKPPDIYYFKVIHSTENDTGKYGCKGTSNGHHFVEYSNLYVGGKYLKGIINIYFPSYMYCYSTPEITKLIFLSFF